MRGRKGNNHGAEDNPWRDGPTLENAKFRAERENERNRDIKKRVIPLSRMTQCMVSLSSIAGELGKVSERIETLEKGTCLGMTELSELEGIHENCRKGITDYIEPEALLRKEPSRDARKIWLGQIKDENKLKGTLMDMGERANLMIVIHATAMTDRLPRDGRAKEAGEIITRFNLGNRLLAIGPTRMDAGTRRFYVSFIERCMKASP